MDNRGHTTRRRLAITWVVVLLTFVAATAGADGLTFLAPERVPGASFVIGLVSLDGQGLAKPTTAVVTATGATLEELTRRGPVRAFLVRPAGQVPVQLQAREAEVGEQKLSPLLSKLFISDPSLKPHIRYGEAR